MEKFIGMMSGTSMDGIDVALIETDGDTVGEVGPSLCRAYTATDRDLLRQALDEAKHLTSRDLRSDVLLEAERMVTTRHAEVLGDFLAQNDLDALEVAAVGFHGQTVLHRPDIGLTVQIGDARMLAELTGVAVVADLRQADMAAGGQGAPLVPVYHRALAAGSGLPAPSVVVNIGGVANLTYVGEPLLAFDTGPGNALLDDWIAAARPGTFDVGGAVSGAGRVHMDTLARLMNNSYFSRKPPKSLDRNDFSLRYLSSLSVEDGAATLAAFTAESICAGVAMLPAEPASAAIVGGGRHNATIMRELTVRLPVPARPAEAVGWRGDFVEAEAFAFLAARSLAGLPLTYPGTTGVAEPTAGGVLYAPSA